MARLWGNTKGTEEGKYPIVLRRDGSVLQNEYFVLVLRDPCAEDALKAYAKKARKLGLDPAYVRDVEAMARRAGVAAKRAPGDPDAPRHRVDNPAVLAWARSFHKA